MSTDPGYDGWIDPNGEIHPNQSHEGHPDSLARLTGNHRADLDWHIQEGWIRYLRHPGTALELHSEHIDARHNAIRFLRDHHVHGQINLDLHHTRDRRGLDSTTHTDVRAAIRHLQKLGEAAGEDEGIIWNPKAYKGWIDPKGDEHNSLSSHHWMSKKLGFRNENHAMENGWVRHVRNDRVVKYGDGLDDDRKPWIGLEFRHDHPDARKAAISYLQRHDKGHQVELDMYRKDPDPERQSGPDKGWTGMQFVRSTSHPTVQHAVNMLSQDVALKHGASVGDMHVDAAESLIDAFLEARMDFSKYTTQRHDIAPPSLADIGQTVDRHGVITYHGSPGSRNIPQHIHQGLLARGWIPIEPDSSRYWAHPDYEGHRLVIGSQSWVHHNDLNNEIDSGGADTSTDLLPHLDQRFHHPTTEDRFDFSGYGKQDSDGRQVVPGITTGPRQMSAPVTNMLHPVLVRHGWHFNAHVAAMNYHRYLHPDHEGHILLVKRGGRWMHYFAPSDSQHGLVDIAHGDNHMELDRHLARSPQDWLQQGQSHADLRFTRPFQAEAMIEARYDFTKYKTQRHDIPPPSFASLISRTGLIQGDPGRYSLASPHIRAALVAHGWLPSNQDDDLNWEHPDYASDDLELASHGFAHRTRSTTHSGPLDELPAHLASYRLHRANRPNMEARHDFSKYSTQNHRIKPPWDDVQNHGDAGSYSSLPAEARQALVHHGWLPAFQESDDIWHHHDFPDDTINVDADRRQIWHRSYDRDRRHQMDIGALPAHLEHYHRTTRLPNQESWGENLISQVVEDRRRD